MELDNLAEEGLVDVDPHESSKEVTSIIDWEIFTKKMPNCRK